MSTGQRHTKSCAKCQETKPLDEFPNDSNTPTRRSSYCFVCRADRNALRRLADKVAGSRAKRFALSEEQQAEVWRTAETLHALGADFATAQRSEETEFIGFVYVISHPRLEGVKVGRAFDPDSRLLGYQTGCPRRAYRLRYATYFENAHTAERAIHARLKAHQLEGEWFSIEPDDAQEAIEAFARSITHQVENI